MTARPAPLTPDEERKLRLDLEYGFGLRADEAAPLMATLDATRAQLAEEREAVDRALDAGASEAEALKRDNRYLLARLDELSAQLTAVQERYHALPKVECACHPGVRWPSSHWGQACQLTKAERESAFLRAALTRAEGEREKMRGACEAALHAYEALLMSDYQTRSNMDPCAGDDVCISVRQALAALSPTQPTPTEGNES